MCGGVNSNGSKDTGKSFPNFVLSENSKSLTLWDCNEGAFAWSGNLWNMALREERGHKGEFPKKGIWTVANLEPDWGFLDLLTDKSGVKNNIAPTEMN